MGSLTYEQWEEKYKPVKNHLCDAPFDGFMFETYDEELDFVREFGAKHIWTLLDGDGNSLFIANGWHMVNRFGYFITEIPWEDGDSFDIEM